MNRAIGLLAFIAAVPTAHAADIAAGKARAEAVCAACHGANGVSVSDTIPNLAAQRPRYLEAQLKALKEGTRKNPVMNAIAAQLSAEDIANVAAHFAALPGAPVAEKSKFLPNLAKSNVSFPDDYRTSFTRYHTINFPATRQVRYYYGNKAAVAAARAGKPLPDGATLDRTEEVIRRMSALALEHLGAAPPLVFFSAALALQYAGLLAERWYFFAEAKHPQNLYYQSIA